jgi:hypothetical protein
MPRREDHQVHKGMWWHWIKKKLMQHVSVSTQKAIIRRNLSTKWQSSCNCMKPMLMSAYTLHWGHLTVLWLFNLVFILYCGCFNLFCNLWVSVCVGVLVMCTCIYCVLYCLYCDFVLFRLCIFILICFVCTSVRTTATRWKLNCSNNKNNKKIII